MAAFDEAIVDGIEVISVTFGPANGAQAREFHNDTVAVDSSRAVRKGIVVSAAAGNDGPAPSTVKNVATWVITVGASSIKRHYFPASVVLGDGTVMEGSSLYTGSPVGESQRPLVFGRDAGSGSRQMQSREARLR